MVIFALFLSTAVFFFQGIGLLPIPLNAYIPWLALTVLRYPLSIHFIKILGISAGVGICLDLLSDYPMGLYPISYTLTSAILFRFRNRFLYDQPLHLALFSSFASLISSLLQLFFLFLFDRRVPISGQWIFIEWVGLSLSDGIYALIWFSGPLFLWHKGHRSWVLFWLKKKNSLI